VAVFDRLLTVWYYNVRNVLHKYANEDVSLGSWFIGLDVEHVDDRRMCCGTPPGMLFWFSSQYIKEKPRVTIDLVYICADCEWKALAGNICVASFDWKCSGICRSVERMVEVHQSCGEDENALWSATFWYVAGHNSYSKLNKRKIEKLERVTSSSRFASWEPLFFQT
jgi:hypothetical protein